ncbi:MAG: 50S ribosomal protein L18e [Candidatus Hydrothermarchaeales archaeon]
MKKSKSQNPAMLGLLQELLSKAREEKAEIWRDLAKRLSRSSSRIAEVNLSRIARYTDKGSIVAVPGKVLGSGIIYQPITVAAFKFSEQAKEKIRAAGGECISLQELMERLPQGSNVKIME